MLFPDGREATLLWVLQGYFVPTTKVVNKVAGKKFTIRHNIKDAQEAIICLGSSARAIEEQISHLTDKKTSL